MSTRQIMIFVGESEREQRKLAEAAVTDGAKIKLRVLEFDPTQALASTATIGHPLWDDSADSSVPAADCLYLSPDIWISLTNDPLAPPVADPEYGQTNYVFVQVHNRSSSAVNNAEIKLHWANPGTNLSKPDWQTIGITVDGRMGNTRRVNVPAYRTSGDGEAITATFEWLPPDPAQNTAEPAHFCLFATVSHPEAPAAQEELGQVRWEAWKNKIVKNVMANSTASAEFYVAGISGASTGDLYIDGTSAPAGGEIRLKLPTCYLEDALAAGLTKVWESAGGLMSQVALPAGAAASLTGIKLRSRENTPVCLEVKLPPDARADGSYPVSVEQRINGRPTGRIDLIARIIGAPAYIADRNSDSLEIHLPTCAWAKKISGTDKVPYDDLQLALRRGYNGCRFCLPAYARAGAHGMS
jgi:hypothetical protein